MKGNRKEEGKKMDRNAGAVVGAMDGARRWRSRGRVSKGQPALARADQMEIRVIGGCAEIWP